MIPQLTDPRYFGRQVLHVAPAMSRGYRLRHWKVLYGPDVGRDYTWDALGSPVVGYGWWVDECDAGGTAKVGGLTRTKANTYIPTCFVNSISRAGLFPGDGQLFWPIPYNTVFDAFYLNRYSAGGVNYIAGFVPPIACLAKVTSVNAGKPTACVWKDDTDVTVENLQNYGSLPGVCNIWAPPAVVDDIILLVPVIQWLPVVVLGIGWTDVTPRIPAYAEAYVTGGAFYWDSSVGFWTNWPP